jgi:DNA-3-methyladenine glycosylase
VNRPKGSEGRGPVSPFRRSFYDRPAVEVAKALLGATIAHRSVGGWRIARLVETEAYLEADPASHSFGGPTQRNRSMFGRPGTLYVFRIHQVVCANAVTRRGEAVLLRAAEPGPGAVGSTRGPGRLCRSLGITLDHDGTDLVQGPVRIGAGRRRMVTVVASPRVGIRRAAELPLRFTLAGNPWVSLPRPRVAPVERRIAST